MTTAKKNHLAARTLLLQHLDLHPGQTVDADLDPAEVGIVGDTSHVEGGDSYHLGKGQIRASGHRYSVDESVRDKRGLDGYASAMDVGYFKITTSRGTFTLRDYSVWLVALCEAGDPDTADLREVIYSPDGKVVHRWDREGVRSSGDSSHLFHTHLSEYRDADGHRMIRLATRWLQHIGLIPEEDEMTKSDFVAWLKDPEVRQALCRAVAYTDGVLPAPAGSRNADGTANEFWTVWGFLINGYNAAVSARAYAAAARDKDAVDEQALASALAAALPVGVQVSEAQLQAAIVGALRELAGTDHPPEP